MTRVQHQRTTLAALLLISVATANAAILTVKSSGGGDYATIQACANAMSAGDTCVVYAGTYNEHVTLTAGGVASYKTLQVNGTDLVYVSDFTLNAHNKLVGFHIQNPSSPTNAPCVSVSANSTDFYITNNSMYACGPYMIKEPALSSNATFGYIQGNTLSYSCSTASAPNVCTAMAINGDHHLIENNDISHVSDGPYFAGKYIVYRKNTFHDLTSRDCGSNSGNCHVDFMQADANVAGGGLPTQYLVIENNRLLNMAGSDMHAMGLFQAEACSGQCFNGIVRFNVAAHFGAGAIVDDNSFHDPPPQAWINVKSYNNSWIDGNNDAGQQLYQGTNSFNHGSTGASEINDLFYYPQSLADFNPYATDISTVASFSVSTNLAFCATSPCNLHGKTYGSGSFTSDPGNIQADPKFTSYSTNNFSLTSDSPAIRAGTYLTTIAAGDSGTGTSLVVNDAAYFQDGFGLGINGDCISVATVTNHVCVTAIDYSTNTLTLASGITRSVDDPVWLYSDSTGRQVLFGSAPDIGAYPYMISGAIQNFQINPAQSITKTASFVRADGTVDAGFGAPITWSVDHAELLKLSYGGQGAPQNNVQLSISPVQPAASQLTSPAVCTITGTFLNENAVQVSSQFTVTIAPNANPATGLLMQ